MSGDLPVVLARLTQRPDPALIRRCLLFHAWARLQGVQTDLIFFCPEESAYLRPCRDAVTSLLSAGTERAFLGAAGGVHIAEGGEAEGDAIESLARLTLRGGLPLHAQLSALRLPPPAIAALRMARPAPGIAPPLWGFNSFGGFSREGDYWALSPAPAPWHNILAGEHFGTLTCETGVLYSWADNSRLGRITRMSPDAHRGMPSEEFYLIDEENRAWPLTACACAHAPGVTEYRVICGGADAALTVFSHESRSMGVRALTVKSAQGGAYRLCWLARFALGEQPEDTRCRAEGDFVWALGLENRIAWAALEGAKGRALPAAAAFGLTGEGAPPALDGAALGEGAVAVLEKAFTLRPRQTLRLTLALGCAPDKDAARKDYAALLSAGANEEERRVRALWSQRLSGLKLFSGEEKTERMINLWLPYQVWAARLLARMGPYQPGGAIGFRDQMQDLLALLYTEPDHARSHILLCAAHQFPEGDVQHWWHAPARGVRTRISDDRLFLPFLTARYVGVTGDEAILAEEIPYLQSPPLADGEGERYENPAATAYTESLLRHCLRAIDSISLGAHGLPLMGGGDWNDGMNRVGGKAGESVWLGFFLILVLREFSPLCDEKIRDKYDELRRGLQSATDSAWTGQWYLRAWREDGRPLGGPDTEPPRIDLISQCFAVFAGAPRNKARPALRAAVDKLYDRKAGIVKLLDPPFAPDENAGYIGAYLPGVRENGGQYTHAVPWLILALCRLGESALAWEIFRAVLPENHTDTREKALRYRLEPYVLAGDVYAGENRSRGGWSWYTGSAAWLYWAALTGLMGFEKQGDRARLRPCPAPDTEEFTLTYRFGSALYHFTAARDVIFPTLDGVKLEDGWAPLISDGRTHEARYPLRNA